MGHVRGGWKVGRCDTGWIVWWTEERWVWDSGEDGEVVVLMWCCVYIYIYMRLRHPEGGIVDRSI